MRAAIGLASANLDGQLSAIAAKTGLIGDSGEVITNAPVAPNGVIDEIIIGDDYYATNNRQFYWDVDPPAGLTITNCTCKFGGKGRGGVGWSVHGDLTLVGNKWRMAFNLPRLATEALPPGQYKWSAAIHGPAPDLVEITKVIARTHDTILRAKQT